MKNLIILAFLTLLCMLTPYLVQKTTAQANFTSLATGNWNAATSWTLASGSDMDGIPDGDDNVTIGAQTITLTQEEFCTNLTISTPTSTAPSNKLALGAFTLNLSGTIIFGVVPTVDNYITSGVGTGRIKFIGSSSRPIFMTSAAFGNVYEVEVAVDPSSTVTASSSLKFRALYITNGTFNVTGDVRIDGGSNGGVNGKLEISSSGTLITSGSIGARSGTTTTYCGSVLVNGTLETTGSRIHGASVTINGTLRLKNSSTLTSEPSSSLDPEFVYGPDAILEYNQPSNGSMGAETGRAASTADPILSKVIINVGGSVSSNFRLPKIKDLEFSSGKLSLNSDATITADGSIVGHTLSKYVVNTNGASELVREGVGGTLIEFPVGTASNYLPVEITNSGAADLFRVSALDVFPSSVCVTSATSATHTWNITEGTPGGSDCTISLTRVNVGAGYETATATIVHCPTSGGFDYEDGAGEVDNKVTGSGFTAFSPFGIGSTASPLPVKFSLFDVENKGKSNNLSFTTLSEVNNDYFTIERSVDGRIFDDIAKITGAGNSSEELNYQYNDNTPANGVNYYRIRQTDYDGTAAYSEIKSVKVGGKDAFTVNPRSTYRSLDISTDAVDYEANLYNVSGQLVKTFTQLSANQTIDIEDMTSGIYYLHITHGGNVETFKVSKL